MEQTVTLIRSSGFNYEIFDKEFDRVQNHLAEMTNAGWMLVTTQMTDRNNSPIMFFWRRE